MPQLPLNRLLRCAITDYLIFEQTACHLELARSAFVLLASHKMNAIAICLEPCSGIIYKEKATECYVSLADREGTDVYSRSDIKQPRPVPVGSSITR